MRKPGIVIEIPGFGTREIHTVDNGEGCALDALLNSNLLVMGATNALDLLLEPRSCKATLRF
jgi:hypothetical protein